MDVFWLQGALDIFLKVDLDLQIHPVGISSYGCTDS